MEQKVAALRPQPALPRPSNPNSSRQPLRTRPAVPECRLQPAAAANKQYRGTIECFASTASTTDQCRRASSAVIRVARQNCCGPIKLLQKQNPHHLMRPGRGAEGDCQLRLAPQFRRKSVG